MQKMKPLEKSPGLFYSKCPHPKHQLEFLYVQILSTVMAETQCKLASKREDLLAHLAAGPRAPECQGPRGCCLSLSHSVFPF